MCVGGWWLERRLHPHMCSQQTVTPIAGNLMPSSVLLGYQAHTCSTQRCMQQTYNNKIIVLKEEKTKKILMACFFRNVL